MKKKVLFVIPYMHEGGAEKILSTIENNFSDEWEIDTLVNSDKDQAYPVKGRLISLGIDVTPKTDSVWFQFKAFLKRVKKLKELKKTGGYESCIGFMDSANIANILSGKKYCKTVNSVHNSLKKSAVKPQYKYVVIPLVRLLYNKSDKIIAVSDGIKEELINLYHLKENKISVIYNGIDLEELKEKSATNTDEIFKSFVEGKRVYFNVGRLCNQKAQWHLIKAFSEVLKNVSDSVLVIAGSGEYEEKLKQIVEKLDIKDKVYFTGFVSNPYMYEKYADVFVLPSNYEGYPVALAEAICMGLPCIATDFKTGAREIIAPSLVGKEKVISELTMEENGILVPVCQGDIDDTLEITTEEKILSEAMIKLVLDEELNKKYRARSIKAGEKLAIENTIGDWMKVAE